MSRRGDKFLVTVTLAATVAALIFLPDWQGLKDQAVRIAHWQVYGR